jgi:hypothetical protein
VVVTVGANPRGPRPSAAADQIRRREDGAGGGHGRRGHMMRWWWGRGEERWTARTLLSLFGKVHGGPELSWNFMGARWRKAKLGIPDPFQFRPGAFL